MDRSEREARAKASAEQMSAMLQSDDPELQARLAENRAQMRRVMEGQIAAALPVVEQKFDRCLSVQPGKEQNDEVWSLPGMEIKDQVEDRAFQKILGTKLVKRFDEGARTIRLVLEQSDLIFLVVGAGEEGVIVCFDEEKGKDFKYEELRRRAEDEVNKLDSK
jgi:hypothetical protein